MTDRDTNTPPPLPIVTIFRGLADPWGKSIERKIAVNPDNFYPLERPGYYGPCMACSADLHEGDWQELSSRGGRRYWCDKCVEKILIDAAAGENQ